MKDHIEINEFNGNAVLIPYSAILAVSEREYVIDGKTVWGTRLNLHGNVYFDTPENYSSLCFMCAEDYESEEVKA
jgi:hypothetical protein